MYERHMYIHIHLLIIQCGVTVDISMLSDMDANLIVRHCNIILLVPYTLSVFYKMPLADISRLLLAHDKCELHGQRNIPFLPLTNSASSVRDLF